MSVWTQHPFVRSTKATTAANLGSMSLSADTARQLATAGKKAEDWRARRDEVILRAHKEGGTLREIAKLVGMSNPGVLRVIRRGDLVLMRDQEGNFRVAEVVDENPSAPAEDIWDD